MLGRTLVPFVHLAKRSLRAGTRPAGSNPNGTERVSGSPDAGVGLRLEMKVRHGRVARVADQGQRFALPEPVAFPDPQRPVPEVRQDGEEARVELDDDDVTENVRGIGHEADALGIVHVAARDDHLFALPE